MRLDLAASSASTGCPGRIGAYDRVPVTAPTVTAVHPSSNMAPKRSGYLRMRTGGLTTEDRLVTDADSGEQFGAVVDRAHDAVPGTGWRRPWPWRGSNPCDAGTAARGAGSGAGCGAPPQTGTES